MNPREHLLAFGVLIVVILAGAAFMFQQLLWTPLRDRDRNIQLVEGEVQTREDRLFQIDNERPKLDRWRETSLPPEENLAEREYQRYLTDLMQEGGLAVGTFTISSRPIDTKSAPTVIDRTAPTGKGSVYSKLTYTVHAQTNLANLVKVLEKFYRTPLMHQIKNLSIQRPLTTTVQQSPTDLNVDLTVEALIVSGVKARSYLIPSVNRRLLAIDLASALQQGPTSLGFALWAVGPTGPLGPGILADPPREYDLIAKKNIFLGKPQRNQNFGPRERPVTEFVHLTDITHNFKGTQAWLYNRLTGKATRLRTESPFNTFRINDDKGEPLVRGKVVKIEDRDVIFESEEKYYGIHVGDNLLESMKRQLSESRKKELKLGVPPAKEGEPKTVASSP